MKALIFAIGYQKNVEPLVNYKPSTLLHIADKPIIFHVIESLINQGVKEIECILHHFPEQIEKRLGDGERWGIRIRYHLIKDPDQPFPMIQTISKKWRDAPIIIGQGDLLPKLPAISQFDPSTTTLIFDNQRWTGWGVIPQKKLKEISKNANVQDLPYQLGTYEIVEGNTLLCTQTLSELVKGNQEQISKQKPDILFPTTSHQVEPGIWISRGVTIEPGAMILPPVFIGIHSQIKSGATIGPNTVIERNSIIENQSRVENSLVCQNSYIGENLEITRCIVDRNSLINLEHGTTLIIQEQFILSDTSLPPFSNYFFGLMERGLAFAFLILLTPIYLFLWATSVKKTFKALCIPTSTIPYEWKTFTLSSFHSRYAFIKFFHRLPYLWEIVKGNLHFIGITPRKVNEVEEMPDDWKKLYLKSKNGLITLAQINHGKSITTDELYASEAYYSVHMSFLFDCKLFIRWLIKKLTLN